MIPNLTHEPLIYLPFFEAILFYIGTFSGVLITYFFIIYIIKPEAELTIFKWKLQKAIKKWKR
jgi:hypothetical protein